MYDPIAKVAQAISTQLFCHPRVLTACAIEDEDYCSHPTKRQLTGDRSLVLPLEPELLTVQLRSS